MKSILYIIVSAVIGLSACSENSNKTDKTPAPQPTANQQASTAVPTTNETRGDITPVLNAYLQIKNGLAKDDGKAAAAGGDAFVSSISPINASYLNAEQRKDIDDAIAEAKEMAEHIGKSSGKIAHQREHFEMLSTDMLDLVKVFKHGQLLYKDHCPMYNDGKGASWISETKDIYNPYLGSKMPTCGKVVEELK